MCETEVVGSVCDIVWEQIGAGRRYATVAAVVNTQYRIQGMTCDAGIGVCAGVCLVDGRRVGALGRWLRLMSVSVVVCVATGCVQ